MTETEWCDRSEQKQMRECLRSLANQRRLRLFAVACCRRVWHLLLNERLRSAVQVTERHADGEASNEELAMAADEAATLGDVDESAAAETPQTSARYEAATAAWISAGEDAREAAYQAAGAAADALADSAADVTADRIAWMAAWKAERGVQWRFLQDIFSNPSRAMQPSASWRTSQVMAHAQAIYDDRAFDRLPALADCLEEAGCGQMDVIKHCRESTEHVRGCWAVDLILGKE